MFKQSISKKDKKVKVFKSLKSMATYMRRCRCRWENRDDPTKELIAFYKVCPTKRTRVICVGISLKCFKDADVFTDSLRTFTGRRNFAENVSVGTSCKS